MHALIVDDSRAMRSVLGRYLTKMGFTVTEAGDGQEALETLDGMLNESVRPQVILVDWNMPVMNGYEFVKAARTRREWADTPIVMVSAENDRNKIARALIAGADEYVMKPVTAEILESKLAILGLG